MGQSRAGEELHPWPPLPGTRGQQTEARGDGDDLGGSGWSVDGGVGGWGASGQQWGPRGPEDGGSGGWGPGVSGRMGPSLHA